MFELQVSSYKTIEIWIGDMGAGVLLSKSVCFPLSDLK